MHRKSAAFVLVGISIVVAAFVAAALSHALIDALGDVVLARDTYDGIAHRSRTLALGFGAAAVALVVGRLWFAAFAEVRRPRGAMRAILTDAARGAGSAATYAATIALTVAALVGMESFDVARDGGSDFGVRAVLGGSLALGLGVTLAAGALFATIVPLVLRAFARSFDFFVAVVREAIYALAPATDPACAPRDTNARPRVARKDSILARRAGKRAPPMSPLAA